MYVISNEFMFQQRLFMFFCKIRVFLKLFLTSKELQNVWTAYIFTGHKLHIEKGKSSSR